MTEDGNFANEINDGKNKSNVRCPFCNSLILKSNAAEYANFEYHLPCVHQKNETNRTDIEKEVVKSFWTVDDMFTFENIGFSNTVNNVKFLICADCEMGPIGYHDLSTKKSYISLRRIKHV